MLLLSHRFLQMLWKIDTEAVIIETSTHGANNSGKYLVMMLLRREHLVGSQQQQSQSQEAALSAANSNTCRTYLKHFAKLRASFKQDKRLVFGVAELHMLESVAWQRQYVSAVKEVKNACPVLVWHPKRTKFIMLDCTLLQKAHMALEQVLDGNAKWLPTEWPHL